MRATYIDYRATNSFSSTVISYLEHDPKLAPFISQEPTLDGFKALLKNKTVTADRHTLVDVLKRQYNELLSSSPAVASNIELISQENTYTITTGHQLNIFTGPLYFIFKIVTAINLAVQLKTEFPDKNFVPVYWMATEDHDFAEINHTNIHGKRITWNSTEHGATGRMSTASMRQAVKEYTSAFGLSENSRRLAELVEQAYQNHSTLSGATRHLVNSLFKDHGLVIVDADEPALKQQFASYIERDILEQNSFREINSSTEKLNKAGFHTQVHPREINFFYLLDGLRERISFEGGTYFVLNSGIHFTPEELKREVQEHPERFSPNVVLRPLYQEIILPNLAYIGGGAEVVYWLQLKQNFDFYGIDFPILMLRNSAMIADESNEQKLTRIGLRLQDLFTGSNELKKNWVLKNTEQDLQLAQEWEELKGVFEKIKLRASQIDQTLSASTEAVEARLHRQIANLEKKLLRAEKRNHSTALSQIDSIKEKLFPNGGLQERSENFGSFYVKHGQQFIHELIRHFKPLDFKFTILY
jgi:bacillithiol biosynthesis cysteine-adding enzyme BshC